MRTLNALAIALVINGLALAPARAGAPGPAEGGPVKPELLKGKKLIRWAAEITNKTSADEVREKVQQWQEAGLDGLCFSMLSHRTGAEDDALHGGMFFRWWNLTRRTREEFVPDIEAFKSVRDWGRLTDNFLLTAVRPLGGRCPDWFKDEDFEIVFSNVRLAAGIAREIGFKGIVFDTEQYGWAAKGPWHRPWSYAGYRGWYKACGHEAPLPFAEVAAKLRGRGKQWMTALQEEFPDIVVLVAPGLYDASWDTAAVEQGLASHHCGLLPAFIDGVLLAMNDRARLVALCERTYGMSQYRDMLAVRDQVKRQALVLSTVPELAKRRISFAVGLWTDAAYGVGKFSSTDARANQRDPKSHEHAVHNALAASDDYAWLYGEGSYFLQWGEGYPFQPDFETRYEEPPPLIREYWAANVRAREPHDLSWVPGPLYDMSDYTKFDLEAVKRNEAFWIEKEEEGFQTVVQLPEHWAFLVDNEMQGRFNNYGSTMASWPGGTWLRVSSKRCWQSQGIRVSGPAFYGVEFDVPADLDVEKREIFLAFGGHGPQAANIYFNGDWIGYFPNDPMPDVTKIVRPGQTNTVIIGFLKTNAEVSSPRFASEIGPGGLAGDVKLLARTKK